jgi:hypothetical protein
MPDRLELALATLEVEWPATPDLAAAVEPRLGEAARRPRRLRLLAPRRPLLAWAAAALVAFAATGLAVSPAARSALLDLLGLKGARVERRAVPPHPTVEPGRLGQGLRLGNATTLDAARRAAGFALTLPASLGTPDAVWAEDRPTRISLVYRRRAGIRPSPHTAVAVLLTQLRAKTTPVIEKALGPGANVTRLHLPGALAYVIAGDPHGFAWAAPDGSVGFEDRRLAGTTLLVERDDGILLRAEGELSAERVRALAAELARG